MKQFFKKYSFAAAIIIAALFLIAISFLLFSKTDSAEQEMNSDSQSEISKMKDDLPDISASDKELSAKTQLNDNGETVFSFSVSDFIRVYNDLYYQNHSTEYLFSLDKWKKGTYDNSPLSNFKSDLYIFSENGEIWPYPMIYIYTEEGDEKVQGIVLCFDNHTYSEDMYNIYEDMCFYTLKAFFPDMENSEITEFYQGINEASYEKFNEKPYENKAAPYKIYYKGDIGVYGYNAMGESMHICVVPVNEEALQSFSDCGTETVEMK